MLRVVIWLTWLIGYFFFCLPTYWKARRFEKNGETEKMQEIVRTRVKNWGTVLLKNIGVKAIIRGTENLPKAGTPVVFAGNHQSFMDIPLVLSALDFPRGLLAKASMSKVPFMGKWMDMLGCVYVQREDLRSGMEAMRKCGERLKNGESIIIFPEGTRSKSDKMGEFKEGTVRIASKAKVPIIPFAIDGTYRILEGNGFKLKKAVVSITFLPAIETSGISREDQKELHGKIAQTIQTELDKNKAEKLTGYLKKI